MLSYVCCVCVNQHTNITTTDMRYLLRLCILALLLCTTAPFVQGQYQLDGDVILGVTPNSTSQYSYNSDMYIISVNTQQCNGDAQTSVQGFSCQSVYHQPGVEFLQSNCAVFSIQAIRGSVYSFNYTISTATDYAQSWPYVCVNNGHGWYNTNSQFETDNLNTTTWTSPLQTEMSSGASYGPFYAFCKCTAGWDAWGSCALPTCNADSSQGVWNSTSYQCDCVSDWTGDNCQTRSCSGHGGIALQYADKPCQCDADSDWSGAQCDAHSCSGFGNVTQGTCATVVNAQLVNELGCCQCDAQHTGANCILTWTEIASRNQCNENTTQGQVWQGRQLNNTDFSVCLCNDDWSGAHCDTQVCNGHGIAQPQSDTDNCVELVAGTFVGSSGCCVCDDRWTGPYCQTPVCSGHGFVNYTQPENKCAVASGWVGHTGCCECDGNWVSSSTTGADCNVCAPGWGGDDCNQCAHGWSGANCDSCAQHRNGINCDCSSGWTGFQCDQVLYGTAMNAIDGIDGMGLNISIDYNLPAASSNDFIPPIVFSTHVQNNRQDVSVQRISTIGGHLIVTYAPVSPPEGFILLSTPFRTQGNVASAVVTFYSYSTQDTTAVWYVNTGSNWTTLGNTVYQRLTLEQESFNTTISPFAIPYDSSNIQIFVALGALPITQIVSSSSTGVADTNSVSSSSTGSAPVESASSTASSTSNDSSSSSSSTGAEQPITSSSSSSSTGTIDSSTVVTCSGHGVVNITDSRVCGVLSSSGITGCCECDNHWESSTVPGTDCDVCSTGWGGADCNACATGWTGSNCDTCGIRRSGVNCDCDENWTGPECVPYATSLQVLSMGYNYQLPLMSISDTWPPILLSNPVNPGVVEIAISKITTQNPCGIILGQQNATATPPGYTSVSTSLQAYTPIGNVHRISFTYYPTQNMTSVSWFTYIAAVWYVTAPTYHNIDAQGVETWSTSIYDFACIPVNPIFAAFSPDNSSSTSPPTWNGTCITPGPIEASSSSTGAVQPITVDSSTGVTAAPVDVSSSSAAVADPSSSSTGTSTDSLTSSSTGSVVQSSSSTGVSVDSSSSTGTVTVDSSTGVPTVEPVDNTSTGGVDLSSSGSAAVTPSSSSSTGSGSAAVTPSSSSSTPASTAVNVHINLSPRGTTQSVILPAVGNSSVTITPSSVEHSSIVIDAITTNGCTLTLNLALIGGANFTQGRLLLELTVVTNGQAIDEAHLSFCMQNSSSVVVWYVYNAALDGLQVIPTVQTATPGCWQSHVAPFANSNTMYYWAFVPPSAEPGGSSSSTGSVQIQSGVSSSTGSNSSTVSVTPSSSTGSASTSVVLSSSTGVNTNSSASLTQSSSSTGVSVQSNSSTGVTTSSTASVTPVIVSSSTGSSSPIVVVLPSSQSSSSTGVAVQLNSSSSTGSSQTAVNSSSSSTGVAIQSNSSSSSSTGSSSSSTAVSAPIQQVPTLTPVVYYISAVQAEGQVLYDNGRPSVSICCASVQSNVSVRTSNDTLNVLVNRQQVFSSVVTLTSDTNITVVFTFFFANAPLDSSTHPIVCQILAGVLVPVAIQQSSSSTPSRRLLDSGVTSITATLNVGTQSDYVVVSAADTPAQTAPAAAPAAAVTQAKSNNLLIWMVPTVVVVCVFLCIWLGVTVQTRRKYLQYQEVQRQKRAANSFQSISTNPY